MKTRKKKIPNGFVEKVFFGSQILYRARCPKCKSISLLADGYSRCCDYPIPAPSPDKIILSRESDSEYERSYIPVTIKEAVLAKTGHMCIYCENPLIDGYHIDHFEPWSYAGGNLVDNLFPSCPDCNLAKSDLVFLTIDDAKVYLARKRGSI